MDTLSEFIIVENDSGLSVVQVSPGETHEDAAVRNQAVVVDSGPYHSYEQAYEAMQQVPAPDDPEELD